MSGTCQIGRAPEAILPPGHAAMLLGVDRFGLIVGGQLRPTDRSDRGDPCGTATGWGLPVTEFSKTGPLKIVSAGGLPPVAAATAHCTARRTLSFSVETVNSLKSGLSSWTSVQKQPSELPSDVASAGIDRPDCLERGSAPTSDGPKSETMTSILLFLAISAVRTFCVSAGSQFVTSKGSGLRNLYSGPSTDFRPVKFVETLAVAGRAAQEQKVAALRQHALDPVRPSSRRRS